MFTNILEYQAHFSNERVCIEYLERQRWAGNPSCPHCGSEQHYRVKTRFKNPELAGYKDYVCKACRKKYTTLTGTIYESSKIPLRKWFIAAYMIITQKKGVSSLHISRTLGISPKSAWFLMHRIRAFMKEREEAMFEEAAQADETFIGGKNKNRHRDKKVPQSQGRSYKDKTPVAGVLQPNVYELRVTSHGKLRQFIIAPSQVRCKVIPNTKSASIHPFINDNVKKGSILVSDEWKAYSGLGRDYDHRIVDHRRKEYVNANGDTSNGVENFWSQLKRGILGIYHFVSRKHLQRYCDEFCFRHNHRLKGDCERVEHALKRSNNVRLMYRDISLA